MDIRLTGRRLTQRHEVSKDGVTCFRMTCDQSLQHPCGHGFDSPVLPNLEVLMGLRAGARADAEDMGASAWCVVGIMDRR